MTNLTKLKPGDIFFSNDDSFASRLIRYVETGGLVPDTKNIPSHCGVITDVQIIYDWVKVDIVEAVFGGVRKGSIYDYVENKEARVWFARIKDPKQIAKGLEWVEGEVGNSYAFYQLGILLIISILEWLKQKVEQPWLLNSSQKYICSELVERYARKAWHKLTPFNPNLVSPYNLFQSKEIEFINVEE